MKYIAALDYEHLDNGVFLTTVGKALQRQEGVRSIVVHGESEYTERLIQTGIMRDEARIRCIKDLNHRLVALFADQGVATIGLNGYQRELITLKDGKLTIDTGYFDRLPPQPVLLLSNLVLDSQTREAIPVSLPDYIDFLADKLSVDEIFLFSTEDLHKPGTGEAETGDFIPKDLQNLPLSARITTASAFEKIPELSGSARLEEYQK